MTLGSEGGTNAGLLGDCCVCYPPLKPFQCHLALESLSWDFGYRAKKLRPKAYFVKIAKWRVRLKVSKGAQTLLPPTQTLSMPSCIWKFKMQLYTAGSLEPCASPPDAKWYFLCVPDVLSKAMTNPRFLTYLLLVEGTGHNRGKVCNIINSSWS